MEEGAAHSHQASTCPVDAASSLYYPAHPQRKSLQIPSFLPAAGGPPPGSGAKEWNPALCPLPPVGIGLGAGGSNHVVVRWRYCGGLQVAKAFSRTEPKLWALVAPPQPESPGWEGAIVILGAPEHPNSSGPRPPGASIYPGDRALSRQVRASGRIEIPV